MKGTYQQIVSRVLILMAVAYVTFSVPVRADYCSDICTPSCNFFIANCQAHGGSAPGLCSCGLDQNGNYSQCMFPSCTTGGGTGGDGGGGDCDFGCNSGCPQMCN